MSYQRRERYDKMHLRVSTKVFEAQSSNKEFNKGLLYACEYFWILIEALFEVNKKDFANIEYWLTQIKDETNSLLPDQ